MTLAVVVVVILRYDFIEIRDGTLENADVLGRHCSNIAPAPIISSGPSLQIRFVSDYAHQGAGFSLRYEIFKTGENEQDERFRIGGFSTNRSRICWLMYFRGLPETLASRYPCVVRRDQKGKTACKLIQATRKSSYHHFDHRILFTSTKWKQFCSKIISVAGTCLIFLSSLDTFINLTATRSCV